MNESVDSDQVSTCLNIFIQTPLTALLSTQTKLLIPASKSHLNIKFCDISVQHIRNRVSVKQHSYCVFEWQINLHFRIIFFFHTRKETASVLSNSYESALYKNPWKWLYTEKVYAIKLPNETIVA